jgi:hydroxymethylpyrimidine/phosphomethylpyrimidine kinase
MTKFGTRRARRSGTQRSTASAGRHAAGRLPRGTAGAGRDGTSLGCGPRRTWCDSAASTSVAIDSATSRVTRAANSRASASTCAWIFSSGIRATYRERRRRSRGTIGRMRIALTIAGSDSGGGAGIQADLRTFAALGVHGASAISAVTAQNTVTVTAWVALEPSMVVAQVEAVATDMPVAATKTGMLATAGIVAAVADAARRLPLGPLVVDPVMVAKSGDRLLAPEAERAYVERLFPLAALVTPNLLEAEVLLGRPVRDLAAMRDAARDLCALGPRAALVKGGRLEGDAVDVLCVEGRLLELRSARVDTRHTQGTGCTLSAAICAHLARGGALEEAVRAAKEYLAEAIRRAYATGRGRGPLDHLHPLRPA